MTLRALTLPGVTVVRAAEAYPGIAGFRVETLVRSTAPLLLGAAVPEQARVGRAAPTLHAFRAGSDWRDPDWTGRSSRSATRTPAPGATRTPRVPARRCAARASGSRPPTATPRCSR